MAKVKSNTKEFTCIDMRRFCQQNMTSRVKLARKLQELSEPELKRFFADLPIKFRDATRDGRVKSYLDHLGALQVFG